MYSDRLLAGQSGFDSRQGKETFLYWIVSRPTLRPTQPRTKWVPGTLSMPQSGRSVQPTTHVNLEPKSRINELCHTCSWSVV
jgi:hypothetical protein